LAIDSEFVITAVLILIGALAAHVSVNTFNEYFDFRSGLDERTTRTPFSGGSGSLVAAPGAAGYVLKLAITSLLLTMAVGIYFVMQRGPGLLPLGIVGVLIIVSYTQWINRSALLCLIVPGLGFGPLMVVGTAFVLTGEYSQTAILVSLVPFFLANNLLLLNQYPDIEADASVGRKHFPITYGTRAGAIVHGIFGLSASMIIIFGVQRRLLPEIALFALMPMLASFIAFIGAWRFDMDSDKLLPSLALNVVAAVVTPLVLALAVLFA
jgi:1,4-dihydroxy-2-naphthoate octaprenyltransferase